MPAFQHLLQRWGFVKLRRFGLELTSDGRIVSTRPVLDDGTGNRIVGWQDGDVSIWKLAPSPVDPSKNQVAPAAPVTLPTQRAAASAAPIAAAPATRSVVAPVPVTPAISRASPAEPPAEMRPSARALAVEVAADAPVDEDDWEWTIALAHARVAVEQAESARSPEPTFAPRFAPPVIHVPPLTSPEPRASRPPTPPPVSRPPTPAPVSRPPTPAPVSRPPTPAPARPTPPMHPAQQAEWIRAAAAGFASEDDRVTRPAAEPARPAAEPARTTAVLPTVAIPRTTTPSTVIPVPPLPTIDAAVRSRMEPVIRTVHIPPSHGASSPGPSSPGPASAINRFAKGTSPLDSPGSPRQAAVLVEDTIPNLSVGDRTTPGIAPASAEVTAQTAAIGERTRPGIALPAVARAVQLPSIKRRSAPR